MMVLVVVILNIIITMIMMTIIATLSTQTGAVKVFSHLGLLSPDLLCHHHHWQPTPFHCVFVIFMSRLSFCFTLHNHFTDSEMPPICFLKKSPLSRVHHLWHSLQTTVARENILYHLWSKHLKFHFDLWDILDCLWVNVVILESCKGVENGDVGLTQQTDGAGQKYKPEKHSYSLLIATNNNHNHLNYQHHSNY